jgi:protein-S-isoprenylcysteine O-methyltransferase Ste14
MSVFFWIILVTGTAIIAWFSWQVSLKDKRYHGIARFFSFESILVLLLLNYPVWFRDPFVPRQILSWFLLFFSIYPAVAGFVLLHRKGKPIDQLEETVHLVTSGIYRYIRNPMYLSLLLLGTGIMLKDPGIWQIGLSVVNVLALVITARVEEKEMFLRFGEEYTAYKKQSKMFIPYIF